jgi:peptidoglycan/LPS O-acetylase OafA/YrhL
VKRAFAIVAGIAAAFVLYALGAIFFLNGSQWDWWGDACWVTAFVALVLGARGRRGRSRPVAIVAGVAAVVGATVVMASRYSDPYGGPLLWPHTLAVVAFAGVVAVLAGMARLR